MLPLSGINLGVFSKIHTQTHTQTLKEKLQTRRYIQKQETKNSSPSTLTFSVLYEGI